MAFYVYAKLRTLVEEVTEIIIVQLCTQERITMHCQLMSGTTRIPHNDKAKV